MWGMAMTLHLGTKLGVISAAAVGMVLCILFFITAATDPNGFDYGPVWFGYLSLALGFYSTLAAAASRLSRASHRRRWLIVCAVASGLVAVLGGGIGSLIVFGPSTGILGYLAIRG
jgi:hypothetical protein